MFSLEFHIKNVKKQSDKCKNKLKTKENSYRFKRNTGEVIEGCVLLDHSRRFRFQNSIPFSEIQKPGVFKKVIPASKDNEVSLKVIFQSTILYKFRKQLKILHSGKTDNPTWNRHASKFLSE